MEVKDLQVPEPHLATNVDTVVFIVKGNQYRLEHTTDNSGLCGSGGTIGNFGSNLIRLTRIFTIPKGTCDTVRVPKGEFKSVFKGDNLYLGPETQVFITQFTDTMIYHFRLTK